MKPTREQVLELALKLEVKPILYTDVINDVQMCRDDLWLLTTEQLINLCSAHLAKPLAESAVAPGECGSVPDERIVGAPADAYTLIQQAFHRYWYSHMVQDVIVGAHAQTSYASAWAIWNAALGMQPPNNQPNLICKSCGVDRSKEDCKGDRLKCGLAGIAYSDHVAVTSAKQDSVHLAVPVESADTRLADFRDTVLNQRGALAENGMTNDQINDVLSEFDACFNTDGITTDHCIELAEELQKVAISMAIGDTRAAASLLEDVSFRGGMETACDEIETRLGLIDQSGINPKSYRPNKKDVVGEGK